MPPQLSFVVAVFFEIALLGVAFVWGLLFRGPVVGSLSFTLKDAVLGLLAALPLLGFFIWSLKSKLPVFTRHRQLLDLVIPVLFREWALWQLLSISLCAGVCEETLFRGAIQASLTARIGAAPALLAVALLFGASHLLSWTYGIIAGVIGVYLGLLFLMSDNLLAPVIAHALYDFFALLYFLRIYRGPV